MRWNVTTRLALGATALVLSHGCVGVLEGTPTWSADPGSGSRGMPRDPSDPSRPPPVGPDGALRPEPAGLRLMTRSQYARSVRDVLGLTPDDDAPVTPVGNARISIRAAVESIAPSTLEEYGDAAFATASWVVADATRARRILGCDPASTGTSCAARILDTVGRRAFRRALTEDERARWLGVASSVAEASRSPVAGIEALVAGLLQSPNFLYRVEVGVPESTSGRVTYRGTELATRLAYFLWGTTPDEALLDAAESGALDTDAGLRAVVDRMLADPRTRVGMREFVSELFEIDALDHVERYHPDFPSFSEDRGALVESFLATAVATLEEGALAELFSTQHFLVDARVAPYLGLAVAGLRPNEFVRRELPAERAGLLTHPAFLALYAHYERKTSPTFRGLFVRKRILCGVVPPPPPGISTILPETRPDRPMTARELLAEHQRNPVCASCHAAIDPIGLGLENFDQVGAFRTTDLGLPIDASGEMEGFVFDDAVGLAHAITGHPALASCLTTRAVELAAAIQLPTVPAELAEARPSSWRELALEVAESPLFRVAYAP